MDMATRSTKRLQRALNKASGRKKGLLLANAKANYDVYGIEIITSGEVQDLRRNIASEEERRSYNRMLDAEDTMRVHISNTQVRYLQLREQLANLGCLFTLFRQHVRLEEYLTELSWGKTKGARALRERIGSSGHGCLFGLFGLREEDGYSFVDIAVSEEGMKLAREFMGANDVHFTAYEDLLNGWERELRELVRLTKRRLLLVDFEGWAEIREFYAQSGEERLELVEALPEYESIAVDEASLDEMLASLDSDLNTS